MSKYGEQKKELEKIKINLKKKKFYEWSKAKNHLSSSPYDFFVFFLPKKKSESTVGPCRLFTTVENRLNKISKKQLINQKEF